jgi:hypothetical protein
MIYFARIPGTTGALKIGRSRDASQRVKAFNGELLAVTDVVTEKEVHRAFQPDWLHGEWFRDSQDVLAIIAMIHAKPEAAAVKIRQRAAVNPPIIKPRRARRRPKKKLPPSELDILLENFRQLAESRQDIRQWLALSYELMR